MSLWSSIKSTISKVYTKVDSKVGGVLPGGAPKTSGGTSSGGTSTSGGTTSGTSSGGSSSSGGGSITTTTIAPTTIAPIRSTDYVDSSGKSVGGITIQGEDVWKKSGGGGGQQLVSPGSSSVQVLSSSFSPQQTQSLVESRGFIIQPQKTIQSQTQSSLAQKITALESTPLGAPTTKDERGIIKKGWENVVDFVSGQTGGVWLTHFGRPTGYDAPEIKKEFKESTTTGLKNTILLGIPGVFGFTAEGKLKTIWSKDKEKRIDIGLGTGTSTFAEVQKEWGKSAMEIRESGRTTLAEQQVQATNIEQISKDIDTLTKQYSGELTSKEMSDIALGKTTYEDVLKEKVKAPGVQSKLFEKEAETYQKEVEQFNAKYGDKQLNSKDYEQALKEKERIDAKRETLLTKQTNLSSAYESYESGVVEKVASLRSSGVETKLDAEGNIIFSSKALDKIVAPVGMKLQKDFMKADKITWKNIVYGGGAVAHTTAEAVAIGFATGGTGALAKVGQGVSKLPKIAQTIIKGGSITLAGVGIASKGYSGYKLAQQVDVPGWYGATLGTTTGIGQIGGFAVGGYYGTKAYFSGVQDKIISGKYTKSIAELREGKIQVDLKSGETKGGLAKQLGAYETKVKGTEWKIKTNVEMKGLYGKESGMSDIKAISQFQGKAPKGMPKAWTTKGQTLESGDYVKLRAFTKSTKAKVWYEQDFLLKRTMIDKIKVDVSQKPLFKGYTELERLKFLTSIKAVGKPTKVGKVLPQNIFKEDEIFRFVQYKGTGKVMQPWEMSEAKADSIFGTKQFILYKGTKPMGAIYQTPGGDVKISSSQLGIKEFQSLGKSSGISAELLKQQLKDTILLVKESQLKIMSDKSGQLTILKPKPSVSPTQLQRTYSPQVIKPTTMIDTKELLKIQLSKIVPGLIQKQVSTLKTPTLLFGAGITGTKQILETRQALAVLNEQALMQKLQQVTIQKVIQQQIPTQTTALRQAQALQEVQLEIPKFQTPISATPIVTSFPGIPIIPGFAMPDLWGWKYQKGKETLSGKKSSGYIQDFTSKVLDLKPKVLSKAQLRKLLKTELTGLEIRRGVIPA